MTTPLRYELILCLRDARRLRREMPTAFRNTQRGLTRRITFLRRALKTT